MARTGPGVTGNLPRLALPAVAVAIALAPATPASGATPPERAKHRCPSHTAHRVANKCSVHTSRELLRHRKVGRPQTTWAPVGRAPLSDAQAAALVTPKPEQRLGNLAANDYVPSSAQLLRFHATIDQYGVAVVQENPLNQHVDGLDGMTNPSTDDLIQWGAHKWGIPEDWLRAEYVRESDWRQSEVGDRASVSTSWYGLYTPLAQIAGTSEVFQSMGISMVKWKPDNSQWPGTEPLRWKSTAFNIDYQAAQVRYYYDGYCGWCTTGYSPGQQWNSIGAWYEPSPWANGGAESYIASIQKILAEKPWLSSSF